MTNNVHQLPPQTRSPWHFPYHEWDRVIVEDRQIPKLTALDEGDEVAICLDGRFVGSFPQAYGYQAAWLIANALAIGAGYSHLGALTKERPFAPICSGLDSASSSGQPVYSFPGDFGASSAVAGSRAEDNEPASPPEPERPEVGTDEAALAQPAPGGGGEPAVDGGDGVPSYDNGYSCGYLVEYNRGGYVFRKHGDAFPPTADGYRAELLYRLNDARAYLALPDAAPPEPERPGCVARARTAPRREDELGLREALADAKSLLNQIALERRRLGPLATQAQQMTHRLAALAQPAPGASVAQRLEPAAHNGLVAGSNPAGCTNSAPPETERPEAENDKDARALQEHWFRGFSIPRHGAHELTWDELPESERERYRSAVALIRSRPTPPDAGIGREELHAILTRLIEGENHMSGTIDAILAKLKEGG